jgi:hypothetical protein
MNCLNHVIVYNPDCPVINEAENVNNNSNNENAAFII